jgi:hypothetical protein
VRALKIRAANEGRKLKEVVADVITVGLGRSPSEQGPPTERVRLPLVECAHEAAPDEELTPDRVAELLLLDEAGARGAP